MLSPEQLFAAETETDAEALDGIIGSLVPLGFPGTAWQPGAKARTLTQAFAKHLAGAGRAAPKLLRSVLLGLAKGEQLDLLAYYMFGGKQDPQWLRFQARSAERTVRFAVLPSASDIAIAPGSVVGTRDGVTFATTNGAPILVVAGATSAAVTIRASVPGIGGNVPEGAVTKTTYPGTQLLEDTITLPGVAVESDKLFTERLEARYALLTYAVGARAYALWSRQADVALTRIYVDDQNPGGANTIYVYGASADGPATLAQVAAMQAAYTVDRRAINDLPTAFAATSVVRSIAAAPTVRVGGATRQQIEDALRTFAATLPIGGERIPAGSVGKLYRDSLLGVMWSLPGMVHPNLTLPAADSTLAPSDIITPSVVISPVVYV